MRRVRGEHDEGLTPLIRPSGTFSPHAGRRKSKRMTPTLDPSPFLGEGKYGMRVSRNFRFMP
jgi:hypothetical protein